ncbi:hypothetical protein VAS14_06503 [Photobacterium angustum S14]|uniref:Uncharacterized protein n=1 Tax=Photobacterium angustum (strain S14 / CCUG 15956) TaxID=314292 RepID=Q1ZRH7_PHOAS|nr:hypothetical protein VAS14_06503 [Photobacterium angustum S14]
MNIKSELTIYAIFLYTKAGYGAVWYMLVRLMKCCNREFQMILSKKMIFNEMSCFAIKLIYEK